MSAQEELQVRQCLDKLFADGGLTTLDPEKIAEAVKQCLIDLGVPLPSKDGGFPLPQFDAGIPNPPTPPTFDGGFPKFDAGIPFPNVDAGIPQPPTPPTFDGGFTPPTFDAGSFLQPCAAGCTCTGGKQCINAANATCPAKFAFCF